jgi:ABC-2 type transport system permease protein
MITRRSWAIAGTSMRLLLSDPAPIIVTTVMPLVLAPFLIPAAAAQLQASGYATSNGSEQIVPGLAVLFAFLSVQLIGTLFFREHVWGTWDRLRVSSATTADIVLGKVMPLFVVQLGQLALLLVIGTVLFSYRVTGSPFALALVLASFAAMLVTYGVMLVAVFRSMDLALVVGNLGGMLMAGVGGAFAPVSSLPQWAQAVAPFSPAYWAIDAMRQVTLNHADLSQIAPSLGVMTLFSVGFSAIVAWRFRVATTKVGTS